VAIMTDVRLVTKFVWTHPANHGQRTRALARAVRFQARLGDRSVLWAGLHRAGASKVVYANPPDHPEMIVWRRILRPRDLFLDVGANVGSYTIWAGELGAQVIALEPAPDTYALLLENINLNGYRAEAIQAAAGATCGTARFTTGLDSVNRLDPSGSAQTRVVTIDSLLGNRTAAGIKVDVEGFEIEVLRGCHRALAEQRILLIQLEWNMCSLTAVGTDRRPIADLLAGYGYRLYRPDRDGALVPLTDTAYGPDVFACPDMPCRCSAATPRASSEIPE
jgi:FkbM family methyltransferase